MVDHPSPPSARKLLQPAQAKNLEEDFGPIWEVTIPNGSRVKVTAATGGQRPL